MCVHRVGSWTEAKSSTLGFLQGEYPEGCPLMSLLALPVAPVPEESAHLASSKSEPAAYPIEVQCLCSAASFTV